MCGAADVSLDSIATVVVRRLSAFDQRMVKRRKPLAARTMRFVDCLARVLASVFGGGDQRAVMSSVTAVAEERFDLEDCGSEGGEFFVGEFVAGVFVVVHRRADPCAEALPEGLECGVEDGGFGRVHAEDCALTCGPAD